MLLRSADPSLTHEFRAYLIDNHAYLQPWEPLRDDAFFDPDVVSERLQSMAQKNANGDALLLLMFTRESNRLIGTCNFANIVRGAFQACHLGFSVAEDLQGRGLMAEGLRLALAYVFDQMGLHRVMANHRPENHRSARLLARLGFQREGEARSYLKINGVWADHVLTSLINPKEVDGGVQALPVCEQRPQEVVS
ncbi:GNAT family N-acetyltransferase [Pigmentiphaga aceris]|uniref:GNAT family N-acetyltransferase n=1 Tax=Pigmentiphaga aceris TaxID=1940612 RepID=UPI001FE244AE|nr:GNAT family N-acetyltransferase [Pigmentiphaga aceris]